MMISTIFKLGQKAQEAADKMFHRDGEATKHLDGS